MTHTHTHTRIHAATRTTEKTWLIEICGGELLTFASQDLIVCLVLNWSELLSLIDSESTETLFQKSALLHQYTLPAFCL